MAKKPKTNPHRESIFEALARHNPGYQSDAVSTRREPDDLTELRKETRQTREELARLRAENERLQREMRYRPAAAARKEEELPDPSSIDLETNMPDPDIDLKGYLAERDRRVQAREQLRARRATMEAERMASHERAAQDAWNRFATRHPEWARNQERVEAFAPAVMKKARAKGLDGEAYLASDDFLDDLAAKLETEFGKPKVEKRIRQQNVQEDDLEDDLPLEADDDAGADDDDDEDDGRTAGIFGGTESGGKPSRRSAQPEGDMLKDLKDIQMKTGFF